MFPMCHSELACLWLQPHGSELKASELLATKPKWVSRFSLKQGEEVTTSQLLQLRGHRKDCWGGAHRSALVDHHLQESSLQRLHNSDSFNASHPVCCFPEWHGFCSFQDSLRTLSPSGGYYYGDDEWMVSIGLPAASFNGSKRIE